MRFINDSLSKTKRLTVRSWNSAVVFVNNLMNGWASCGSSIKMMWIKPLQLNVASWKLHPKANLFQGFVYGFHSWIWGLCSVNVSNSINFSNRNVSYRFSVIKFSLIFILNTKYSKVLQHDEIDGQFPNKFNIEQIDAGDYFMLLESSIFNFRCPWSCIHN